MPVSAIGMQSIRTFFENEYFIPSYQRDYSWDDGNISDFWNDIIDTIHIGGSFEHFLGQILIHKDIELGGKRYLIDGQQRVLTCSIFTRAIQLVAKEILSIMPNDGSMMRVVVNTESILGSNRDEGLSPKLKLGNPTDNDYYQQYVLNALPTNLNRRRKSLKLISSAYRNFYKKIRNYVGLEEDESIVDDAREKLANLYNVFAKKVIVMVLETGELSDAFVIFETLNARGKDLGASDLLKNYIFSKSRGNINIAEADWQTMISNLSSSDPTSYIRHYWNSNHEKVSGRMLYRTITNGITNMQGALNFLNNLKVYSSTYAALNDASLASDVFVNSSLKKSLGILNTLNAKTFYPIVLALKQTNYSEIDIAKVLKSIEIYMFRNHTICGNNPNETEVLFARIALKIFEANGQLTANEICQTININIVTDNIFQATFKEYSSENKSIIRLIFRKIHAYLDGALELNFDNNAVHVEHIMPQNKEQWPEISNDQHEKYLWRLGNLCLLDGVLNESNSNRPFAAKKPTYVTSIIRPNSEISNYDTWEQNSIEDRQSKLAELAVNIWSIPN